LYSLALFYTKILINPKKILVIVQRSNGDVFLSSSLIKALYESYGAPQIDLLINDDTTSIARLIPFIKNIYTFSYQLKQEEKWKQEKNLILKIFKKYDLSISLTASDRSVFYSLMAGKKTISAVENDRKKSWWKKIFLTHYYYFDKSLHILINNLQPLNFLKINVETICYDIEASSEITLNVQNKLKERNISDFMIFHPSTQYAYKVYPKKLRDILIESLSSLGLKIIVTGGDSALDIEIKKELSNLPNIVDFIGETSLEEFIALSNLSLGYIGMDTLNMHIAASQGKRIFAIFGPTNLKMWSPWSNLLKLSAIQDMPIQTYGNVTIFQADMPCVACGKAGCDDNYGISICLNNINPKTISNEIKDWLFKSKKDFKIQVSMDKI